MTKKNIIKAGVAGIATMIPGINGLFEFYSTFCQGQSDERRDKVEEEFKQKFDDIQNHIDNNPSNFAIFLNAVTLAIHGIIDNELYISYGDTSSGHTLQKVAIDYVLTHKKPYIFS